MIFVLISFCLFAFLFVDFRDFCFDFLFCVPPYWFERRRLPLQGPKSVVRKFDSCVQVGGSSRENGEERLVLAPLCRGEKLFNDAVTWSHLVILER